MAAHGRGQPRGGAVGGGGGGGVGNTVLGSKRLFGCLNNVDNYLDNWRVIDWSILAHLAVCHNCHHITISSLLLYR